MLRISLKICDTRPGEMFSRVASSRCVAISGNAPLRYAVTIKRRPHAAWSPFPASNLSKPETISFRASDSSGSVRAAVVAANSKRLSLCCVVSDFGGAVWYLHATQVASPTMASGIALPQPEHEVVVFSGHSRWLRFNADLDDLGGFIVRKAVGRCSFCVLSIFHRS